MSPSRKLFDISPVISAKTGVFPGDVSFQRNVSMDFAHGQHLTLSAITTTLHLGAHADAPNHYQKGGVGISERDVRRYLGNCLVLHAHHFLPGERVSRKHLGENWQLNSTWPAPRILLSTGSFPDPDHWNSDFSSFDPELIEIWAKAGVKLIGIDTPSIDPENSKNLESHQMVARYDLAILEGLVLKDIPEGLYTLIAPPLRIEGADASPVRALLIEGKDAQVAF